MIPPCASCGGPHFHYANRPWAPTGNCCHGWCARCYQRWLNTGRPAVGPPPPQRRHGHPHPGRFEDYQFLRGQGASRAEAMFRLGVTLRTVTRYEAQMRQEATAA